MANFRWYFYQVIRGSYFNESFCISLLNSAELSCMAKCLFKNMHFKLLRKDLSSSVHICIKASLGVCSMRSKKNLNQKKPIANISF